jgi:hypothetical protein
MKDKATGNSAVRPNQTETEIPELREKVPCSPRANIAYSILPALDWVRNTLRRIPAAPPETKTKTEGRADRVSMLQERAKLI